MSTSSVLKRDQQSWRRESDAVSLGEDRTASYCFTPLDQECDVYGWNRPRLRDTPGWPVRIIYGANLSRYSTETMKALIISAFTKLPLN